MTAVKHRMLTGCGLNRLQVDRHSPSEVCGHGHIRGNARRERWRRPTAEDAGVTDRQKDLECWTHSVLTGMRRRVAEEVGDEVVDAILQFEAGHSRALQRRGPATSGGCLAWLEGGACGASVDSAKNPAELIRAAERIGGQDASGWVLCRIGKDSEEVDP
jgi:hypothetical protein